MLPRSFLTQLIPARIAEALRRVEKSIWHPVPGASLEVTQTESHLSHLSAEEARLLRFEQVPDAGFHWGPKFSQRWFHVRLSQSSEKRIRYLVWNDQAEATAYINGVPYRGLDVAHRHCALPPEACDILIEAVCVKTGLWLKNVAPLDEQGSRYSPPQLFWRDDLAWEVYHDLSVLLEILEIECDDYQPGAKKPITDLIRHSPPILRASPLFRRWCARLEAAIDSFDRNGLAAFGSELKKIYAEFPAERDALRAVLTGHAHIDLVWLWPEHVGNFKAVHTWATQVRLLDEYPEFRFSYSQPASYHAVAKRAPALFEQVKQRIADGQWESTGGAYVEFDTQLPCGEGLLRSLRSGQRDFFALRGSRSKTCWLPDVFGYTAALPQLLRGFGIESFFTTKLSWNTVNRMPHTSFRWRGADGSSVLAHVVLLHDYNECVDIRNLREDALHHQQAAVHPEFLVPTGYGDGGGGPTAEMCERARRLANLAGAPRTEWGGIEAFFDRLAPAAQDLPEISGELSFELHRGVFTTHGTLKSSFRALERGLQILEAAHISTARGPVEERLWRRMLFAHFHDHIPGSSIWEVYAEGIPELQSLAREAAILSTAALRGDEKRGWFNPLAVRRSWLDGTRCYELPPLSGLALSALAVREVISPIASSRALTSQRVKAVFGADGALAGLEIDGQDCGLTGKGHALAAYPDHPSKFEAWDIDRASLCFGIAATLVGEPSFVAEALTATLTFSYRIAQKSTVVVRYCVNAVDPVLRIDYDIDWRDPEMLLKGIFSTGYAGREARYGTPFGSILRGQSPGHTREEAQWEVPASRWMIVLDDAQSEGLAIITESKYGFCVRDGTAAVSLLRSAYVTGADEHALIRTATDRPRHSDLGHQHVSLALSRFTAQAPLEEQPAMLADTLFTPCLPCGDEAMSCGLLGISGSPSLIPGWAEPLAAGTWVLRLHETLGRRGKSILELASGWEARIVRMDIELSDIVDEILPWHAGSIAISYSPYQVISVALTDKRHRKNEIS